MTLDDLARFRDDFLERLTQRLAADDRIAAAWLAGSFGRNVDDAWSDLDLHVYVHDEEFAAVLDERALLYEELGPPLLVQPEMPAASPPGGRFQLVLFPGGVELDLTVAPVSQAARPLATRVLIDNVGVPPLSAFPLTPEVWQERAEDRLTFFWAMAPIAIKYAGRGSTLRLVRMIDMLTEAWIDLGNLLKGDSIALLPVNVTNAPLDPQLASRYPVVGETITPASGLGVVEALCADVASWHPDLEVRGISVPVGMPDLVAALVVIARDAMEDS